MLRSKEALTLANTVVGDRGWTPCLTAPIHMLKLSLAYIGAKSGLDARKYRRPSVRFRTTCRLFRASVFTATDVPRLCPPFRPPVYCCRCRARFHSSTDFFFFSPFVRRVGNMTDPTPRDAAWGAYTRLKLWCWDRLKLLCEAGLVCH